MPKSVKVQTKPTTLKSMNRIESEYLKTNNLIILNKEFINNVILNSKYEWTCKVFVQKIKTIKSIIDSLENCDPVISFYTNNILFRSTIEHFLISEYIFTNDRLSKNQKCGMEYFSEYLIGETIKRFGFKLDIQKRITKSEQVKVFDYLKTNYPELAALFNREHDIEISFAVFNKMKNVRILLEYFYHTKQKEPIDDIQNQHYKQFVEKYNELSTYVHGGPTSEFETLNIFNNDGSATHSHN